MSNMSYCRFHNTDLDLRDCENELSEMIETPRGEQALSDDELRAAKSLAVRCFSIVRMLVENAGLELNAELREEDLEEAVANVHTEQGTHDGDEEEDD